MVQWRIDWLTDWRTFYGREETQHDSETIEPSQSPLNDWIRDERTRCEGKILLFHSS